MYKSKFNLRDSQRAVDHLGIWGTVTPRGFFPRGRGEDVLIICEADACFVVRSGGALPDFLTEHRCPRRHSLSINAAHAVRRRIEAGGLQCDAAPEIRALRIRCGLSDVTALFVIHEDQCYVELRYVEMRDLDCPPAPVSMVPRLLAVAPLMNGFMEGLGLATRFFHWTDGRIAAIGFVSADSKTHLVAVKHRRNGAVRGRVVGFALPSARGRIQRLEDRAARMLPVPAALPHRRHTPFPDYPVFPDAERVRYGRDPFAWDRVAKIMDLARYFANEKNAPQPYGTQPDDPEEEVITGVAGIMEDIFVLGGRAVAEGEAGVAQTCYDILEPCDVPESGGVLTEDLLSALERLGGIDPCMDGSFPITAGASLRSQSQELCHALANIYATGLRVGMPLTDDARILISAFGE